MATPKQTLRLKPKAGLIVRDPESAKPLDAKGETKPLNNYWRKRLRDGDVIDMNAPKQQPAPKKAAPEKEAK